MTIYELGHQSTGFVEIRSADPGDSGFGSSEIFRYEPKSVRDRWKHPSVEFNKWDWLGKRASRKKHPEWYEADAFGFGYFTKRAADALADLFNKYGEILPLTSKDGEFCVYHCMNILDAIDRIRCEFRGQRIIRYVFKPEVVRGQDIFLQAAPNEGPTFVSDAFVERVKTAGLRGFRFTPVWNDGIGPISEEPSPPQADDPKHAQGSRPLSRSRRKTIVDSLVAAARSGLGIDVVVDPAHMVLDRIGQEAASAQGRADAIPDAWGASMLLGTLWAELVCRECGWQWAMVQTRSGEVAGIVSPTRSHVVFPHSWYYRLLTVGGEPKINELYEAITSTAIPQADAESYLVLA